MCSSSDPFWLCTYSSIVNLLGCAAAAMAECCALSSLVVTGYDMIAALMECNLFKKGPPAVNR